MGGPQVTHRDPCRFGPGDATLVMAVKDGPDRRLGVESGCPPAGVTVDADALLNCAAH